MMYGWDGGWGAGAWIWMTLVMLLFWGGVITVVILLLRRGQGPAAPGPYGHGAYGPEHEAERILNERFARGEIDESELIARRAALRRKE